jgi:hypothetical protein
MAGPHRLEALGDAPWQVTAWQHIMVERSALHQLFS